MHFFILQNLQGLTGTPLVAGSPIRHDTTVQGNPVEVQTYQTPWKTLSDLALETDLDQPAFQHLVHFFLIIKLRLVVWSSSGIFSFVLLQVSFSESGSLGNSSGSDVTSLSSQLPDTPNSMVPSPVDTWGSRRVNMAALTGCAKGASDIHSLQTRWIYAAGRVKVWRSNRSLCVKRHRTPLFGYSKWTRRGSCREPRARDGYILGIFAGI